jgi:hypothetical protein
MVQILIGMSSIAIVAVIAMAGAFLLGNAFDTSSTRATTIILTNTAPSSQGSMISQPTNADGDRAGFASLPLRM